MKFRRALVLAFLFLAAGSALFASPEVQPGPPPISNLYVFTLAHNGHRQVVEVGSRVEIQLPGEPAVWRLHLVSSPELVAAGLPRVLNSPGRIAGASGIYVFDFDVKGPAAGVAIQLELIHPSGGVLMTRYKLTLDALETE